MAPRPAEAAGSAAAASGDGAIAAAGAGDFAAAGAGEFAGAGAVTCRGRAGDFAAAGGGDFSRSRQSGDGAVAPIAGGSSDCHRTPMRRSFGRAMPFGRVIGSLSCVARPATSPLGAPIGVTSGTPTWTPRRASDGATGSGADGTGLGVRRSKERAAGVAGIQTSER